LVSAEKQCLVGTYAFLDFQFFHAYNFPRPAARISLEGESEGIGDVMRFKLGLVSKPASRASDARAIPTSGRRKTLYFKGTSSSLVLLGDSSVSGSVLETPDGEIRWRFVITCVYMTCAAVPTQPAMQLCACDRCVDSLLTSGQTPARIGASLQLSVLRAHTQPSWALDGVQLGSSGVIVGTWSTADADEHGPVRAIRALLAKFEPYADWAFHGEPCCCHPMMVFDRGTVLAWRGPLAGG
jgi:hypothetical protein